MEYRTITVHGDTLIIREMSKGYDVLSLIYIAEVERRIYFPKVAFPTFEAVITHIKKYF